MKLCIQESWENRIPYGWGSYRNLLCLSLRTQRVVIIFFSHERGTWSRYSPYYLIEYGFLLWLIFPYRYCIRTRHPPCFINGQVMQSIDDHFDQLMTRNLTLGDIWCELCTLLELICMTCLASIQITFFCVQRNYLSTQSLKHELL